MKIQWLTMSGYRSIRAIDLQLGQVNVVTGPNGSGKTNLYRGLLLLAATAEGNFARQIAEEGGMPSVLWAGARLKGHPVRMSIGAVIDEFEYRLTCGLPALSPNAPRTAFHLDPEIKTEELFYRNGPRRSKLLDRKNSFISARNEDGTAIEFPMTLLPSECALSELREPRRFPVLSMLRSELLGWRFYHEFRTDAAAPIREPRVGVRSTVLSHDGSNLAAALQTILEMGDSSRLASAVHKAFPGGRLVVEFERQRFQVALLMPGFQRPFDARELSDGTLQFLCLLAALLSPRPPALLALNEPETSIHPDLHGPLAELIVAASANSQIWITTHSQSLAEQICYLSGATLIRLEKVDGETRLANPSEGNC